jgi:hypothetical protein
MPPLSKIIEKPISDEWGAEGKIDFSNVATVGIFPKNLNLHIIKREQ